MRKITIAFLLIISALNFAKAQEIKDTTAAPATYNKSTYISIGAFATPQFSYRNMKSLDPSADFIVDKANDKDIPSLLFEVGARLNLHFANRLRLTSGAIYSQKGYQSKLEFVDKNTGKKLEETYRSYTTYTFIEVPAYLSFAIAKDSSKTFYLFGGMTAGLLQKRRFNTADYDSIANSVFYPDDKVHEDEDAFLREGYNTTQYALIGGIEGNFNISEHFSLMVQPHFKYFITPVQTKDTGIFGKLTKENLFTVGLSLGVDYRF